MMRFSYKLLLLLPFLLGMGSLNATVLAQVVSNCNEPISQEILDANNVRARVYNSGTLFWNGGQNLYEVPKDGGVNAIFASGIWIAGEVSGQLRSAASDYGPYEFWAGPLDENGNPPADCAAFDEMYSVKRADVETYNQTGSATPDLAGWPTGLGAPTLAPVGNGVDDDQDGEVDEEGERVFFDINEPLANRVNRIIDLAGGERPDITGDQTIWWVMNDLGNSHEWSETTPIGLEAHVEVFSFNLDGPVGDMSFYRYKLFYKGSATLTNAYMGLWSDPDLGNASDDYVGSDSTLGLGFVYNGDDNDDNEYGSAPPAAGYDFFQGPIVPSMGDTALVSGVKVPDFRNLGMTSFVFYNNGGGVQGDPPNGEGAYSYLRGNWLDEQPITFGGNGRGFSTTPTSFMFPGDPETGQGWSEVNPAADGSAAPIAPADRRFVMSTGPFEIQPGDVQEIVFGIVYARGTSNVNSVTELKKADGLAQQAFDVNFDLPQPPAAPEVTFTEYDGRVVLEWSNAETSNNFLESYEEFDPLALDPFADIEDRTYFFEGYEVLQFDDAADQSGEVVGVYDISNGVQDVIDLIPGEPELNEVAFTGRDQGIQLYHIEEQLTNYTTYYFGVRAIAYNELSLPKIFRSPITRVEVVPSKQLEAIPETTIEANLSTDGFDFTGVRTGIGGGTVAADIVDPTDVTGQGYSVNFFNVTIEDPAEAGKSAIDLNSDLPDVVPNSLRFEAPKTSAQVDVLTYDISRDDGTVLFDGEAYTTNTGLQGPQRENIHLFDGLSFSVFGPPRRALQFEDLGLAGDTDPVFVEVQGPGGADPCGPDAVSTFGCAESGGNWLYPSFNGTAEYILYHIGAGAEASIGAYAPNVYEIRITQEGSYALHPFSNDGSADNVFWVPFEVWDIGPEPVGPGNNPDDDVQMIPNIFSDAGGICDFSYGEAEEFGRPATDRIYGYYSTTTYDDWAAAVEPLIQADPMGCPDLNTPGVLEAVDFVDFGRGRPIQRIVLVDNTAGAVPVPDLDGAIIRFYSSKPHLDGDSFTFTTAGTESRSFTLDEAEASLDAISIVPNPYKGASNYERSQLVDEARFTNLPAQATIRIFTLSGSLIRTIEKNSPERSLVWNLNTDNNLPIASGVYLINIETDAGDKTIKFAVVRKRTELNNF